MNVYINPNDPVFTSEQKAWLQQTLPVKPEMVSPLEIAEAADRQLAGHLGLRAMAEGIALNLLPDDVTQSAERMAPFDPSRPWIPIDEVAEQAMSSAVTPSSVDEVVAGLRAVSTRFFRMSQGRQWHVAQQVLRQARRAETEERHSSLEAADAALDEGWTAEKAAAARAHRQQAQTKAWAKAELDILHSLPNGKRLAAVESRLADAGLTGQFDAAIVAVRAALGARAQAIADALCTQAAQAVEKAMLYEIAKAALLAGEAIGADVSRLVEPSLARREAALKAAAEQAATAQAARAELAALKTAPNGDRLAAVTQRLTQARLAAEYAADIADARRAVHEAAFGLALAARRTIRAADDTAALEAAEQCARRSGAGIGAESLVMEHIVGDIGRRRRELDKDAARLRAFAGFHLAEAKRATPAARPSQLDKLAETESLLVELRRRNPRVVVGKTRVRFHALTRLAQEKFATEVVNLQQQIMNAWSRNGRIVVRERGQAGLRIVHASQFQPDTMRLVGLEWMARRMEKRQVPVTAAV